MNTGPDPVILNRLRRELRKALVEAEQALIDYDGLRHQLERRTMDAARRIMYRRDSEEFRAAREEFGMARDRVVMYGNALQAEAAYVTAMATVPTPVGTIRSDVVGSVRKGATFGGVR